MQGLAYGAWAFAAGVLIPVMAALNGALGRQMGAVTWPSVLLFSVALAACLVAAVASGETLDLGTLHGARIEQLAAGLVVAFYVLTATYLTPRFGVAPTVLCVVTAQIVTSAIVSHFGWLGAPRQPIDLIRAFGLALMLGGLILTQTRRT